METEEFIRGKETPGYYQTSNYRHLGQWYWVCGDNWPIRYYATKTNAKRAHGKTHPECVARAKAGKKWI